MRWLTSERGREVRSSDGTAEGRVVDLVIALGTGESHPKVTRLLVASRRKAALVERHDLDGDLGGDEPLIVRDDARTVIIDGHIDGLELHHDELLLVRDVLDTQVVDIDGHRLARVADVALEPIGDGGLEVAGVDVGPARILHRLHLGPLARRRDERFIDWNELHLTSPRGHVVQLAAPSSAIHRLREAELTALLEHLDLGSPTTLPRRRRRRRGTRWQRHGRPRHHR